MPNEYGPQLPSKNQRRAGKIAPRSDIGMSGLTPDQEAKYKMRELARQLESQGHKWVWSEDGTKQIPNPEYRNPNPEPPPKVPQIIKPPVRPTPGTDSKSQRESKKQGPSFSPHGNTEVIPKETRKLPPPPNVSSGGPKFESMLEDFVRNQTNRPKGPVQGPETKPDEIRFPGSPPKQAPKPAAKQDSKPNQNLAPLPLSAPTMRGEVSRHYGDKAGEEIAASIQAQRNRPSDIDMSGFGTFDESRYDQPMNTQMFDPAQMPEKSSHNAFYRRGDDSIRFNSRAFPQGQDSPGYRETLGHEGTHRIARDNLNSPPLSGSRSIEYGNPGYVTSKSEVSARAAEMRRIYTQYTGIPVRDHQDALEAMHWYMQNHGKILKDGHQPVATPDDAAQYLYLPGEEKKKVLQRMLEVAGSDRLRGSLLG